MCLSRFLDEMGAQIEALVGSDSGPDWALGLIDKWERRIHLYEAKLRRTRASLADLRRRILEKSNQIDRLTQRIEIYLNLSDHANAWQYAMALDRLQQLLGKEQALCRRMELGVEHLKSRKRHLQKKLAAFLATFYPKL
jgi:chromosome segregation ATPase